MSFFLQDVEELMVLAPERVLLKWMNFHLKKAGYKKTVTNFSSDLKVFSTSISLVATLVSYKAEVIVIVRSGSMVYS